VLYNPKIFNHDPSDHLSWGASKV
jgi:hypothetical protein